MFVITRIHLHWLFSAEFWFEAHIVTAAAHTQEEFGIISEFFSIMSFLEHVISPTASIHTSRRINNRQMTHYDIYGDTVMGFTLFDGKEDNYGDP